MRGNWYMQLGWCGSGNRHTDLWATSWEMWGLTPGPIWVPETVQSDPLDQGWIHINRLYVNPARPLFQDYLGVMGTHGGSFVFLSYLWRKSSWWLLDVKVCMGKIWSWIVCLRGHKHQPPPQTGMFDQERGWMEQQNVFLESAQLFVLCWCKLALL